MRGLLTTLIALSASQILSVAAQADPACLTNCGIQARADFTKYSCGNADDAPCLCAAPDFKNGVRDCATACGAGDGEADTFINDNFCVGQAPAAPTEEAPEEPATTAAEDAQPEPTQPAEEAATTEQPAEDEPSTTEEPKEEPTTSQEVPEEAPVETPAQTEAEEPIPTPPTTAQEEETTSAVEESTSAAAETTSSDSSDTAGAAKPTEGAEDDKSNEDDDKDKDEGKEEDAGGLSKGAIIGIAVGAGAVGLAILGFLLFLCCRRRGGDGKNDARPFIEISKPMPMSGPGAYTGRTDPFAAEKGNVMELQANRYEDMLPRQVPRTVV